MQQQNASQSRYVSKEEQGQTHFVRFFTEYYGDGSRNGVAGFDPAIQKDPMEIKDLSNRFTATCNDGMAYISAGGDVTSIVCFSGNLRTAEKQAKDWLRERAHAYLGKGVYKLEEPVEYTVTTLLSREDSPYK